MAGVVETIVREYFEHLGFLVRQERKYVTPSRRESEDGDFLVVHPQPVQGEEALPFVLGTAEVLRLARAVVGVRGWHVDVLSPARLRTMPEVLRFVEPAAWKRGLRALGPGPTPYRLLVISGLPRDEQERRETVEMLRQRGVDGVLPLRTILAELVGAAEPNRNYLRSDLFQTLRLLKRYGFLTLPQMELFPRQGRGRV